VNRPQLLTKDGQLFQPKWTRLRPAAEVGASVPQPPEPNWRPGLKFGSARQEEVGEGFDRRVIMAKSVIEDDGVRHIFGKTIQGRPLTGDELKYEPSRAWTAADWRFAVGEAVKILRAHDFPVDLEWPKPETWVWTGEELLWADEPEGEWFVYGDGRKEPASGGGLYRGGLGSLGGDPPPKGWNADRWSAELWPRYSAFGWALQVLDAVKSRNHAKANLCRSAWETADRRAWEAWWSGHGAPTEDEEAMRQARITGDGPASAVWPIDDADFLWRLGFHAGAYLAEHRLRTLHAPMLARGEKNKGATALGAELGNAAKKAVVSGRRNRVLQLAKERLASGVLPPGYKQWSADAIATDVRDNWHPDEAPTISTIRSDLKHLRDEGQLELPTA
jgi:hypothetical protein